MMARKLHSVKVITFSAFSHADNYDVCNDIVIDDVTEMAFGQYGIVYTGEVVCYRDKEKTILKSKRAFDNGLPIGRMFVMANMAYPKTLLAITIHKCIKMGASEHAYAIYILKKLRLDIVKNIIPGLFGLTSHVRVM